ncbi:hypothetical protein [Coralloluteibacterium thermophilus]|uniref:Uncharacterized protein n=1 Tax=Coralloluteibacterium thermophilum TaxID=2707049 RepID=A0ABV9NFU3_9GAMM
MPQERDESGRFAAAQDPIDDAAPAPPGDQQDTPPAEPASPLDALNAALAAQDEPAATGDPAPTAAEPPPAEEPPAQGEPAAKPAEPQNDVDTEVAALGLKGRSEERFRAMSAELSELRPLRERVTELTERAAAADEWEATVKSTGAAPEDFGMALGFLKLQASPRPEDKRQAYEMIQQVAANLAKDLGLDAHGHDALAAHPDLQQLVEKGEVPRNVAAEIAAQRHQQQMGTRARQEETLRAQQQTALERGAAAVDAAVSQLKASDADFARKFPLLQPALDLIARSFPPDQWAAELQRRYAALPPMPAPPRPLPPVSEAPLRPTGAAAGTAGLAREAKSPLEALEMGLAAK